MSEESDPSVDGTQFGQDSLQRQILPNSGGGRPVPNLSGDRDGVSVSATPITDGSGGGIPDSTNDGVTLLSSLSLGISGGGRAPPHVTSRGAAAADNSFDLDNLSENSDQSVDTVVVRAIHALTDLMSQIQVVPTLLLAKIRETPTAFRTPQALPPNVSGGGRFHSSMTSRGATAADHDSVLDNLSDCPTSRTADGSDSDHESSTAYLLGHARKLPPGILHLLAEIRQTALWLVELFVALLKLAVMMFTLQLVMTIFTLKRQHGFDFNSFEVHITVMPRPTSLLTPFQDRISTTITEGKKDRGTSLAITEVIRTSLTMSEVRTAEVGRFDQPSEFSLHNIGDYGRFAYSGAYLWNRLGPDPIAPPTQAIEKEGVDLSAISKASATEDGELRGGKSVNLPNKN